MEWCAIASLLALTMVAESAVPLINAPWGALQGIRMEGDGGRQMNAYLGIPFAVPPVGELRFEKPLPHPGPGHGETFVADQRMPACQQVRTLLVPSVKTSEDCLKLDVYVPTEGNAEGPYAVMIFIHGGGFTFGDAYSYRPSKLVADGKVIVVVIQYRLGTYGFLSTGDGTVPGNMGLWDQHLAFRWVKDNIQAFGGDSDRITIFGESAGSMSVGLQLMSRHSRGLFHRGIMQSGVPQFMRTLNEMLDMKSAFKGLADVFDCQGESTAERLKCLKEQPEELFFNKSTEYAATSPMQTYFVPNIDGEFITTPVLDQLQDSQFMEESGARDVDLIIGMNNKEGALVLFLTAYSDVTVQDLHSRDTSNMMVDACLLYKNLQNNDIVKKTLEFYYHGAEAGANMSKNLDALVDMYGDCIMNADTIYWAQQLAASSHSAARYVYVFDHNFAFNEGGPVPGTHHGDELTLEFDNDIGFSELDFFKKLNKTGIPPEEQPLSDKFVQILTSFAKTGNPSPPLKDDLGGEWPQFTTESETYVSLSNSPRIVPNMDLYRDRSAFWVTFLPELSRLTAKLPKEEVPASQEEALSKDEL